MISSTKKRSTRVSVKIATAGAVGLSAIALLIPFASATNLGTKSGVETPANSCDVRWTAATVMDSDLQNDDPKYPGLMVDLDGKPMSGGVNAFTNGGYIKEVNPAYGHPGYLELTHFYLAASQQVWRPVIASDKPMSDVIATFTLPEQVRNDLGNYTISLDVASVNSKIGNWGGNYGKYTWSPISARQLVDNGDGTITANIGNLDAMHGTVFQFMITNTQGNFVTTDQFITTATLTGKYEESECPAPEPTDTATPTETSDPTDTTEPTETTKSNTSATITTSAGDSDNGGNPSSPNKPTAPVPTGVGNPAAPTAHSHPGQASSQQGQQAQQDSQSSLANTGANVLVPGFIALGLIAAGIGIVVLRRRA